MTDAAMPWLPGVSCRRPSALLLFVLLFAASAALAVPPPPQREPRIVDLRGTEEVALEGEVRAYDGESIEFHARGGEALLVRMVDASGVLSLSLESPSGAALLDGARPAADGLRVVLAESGQWRVLVRMDADAARRGRSARFALTLRLLR